MFHFDRFLAELVLLYLLALFGLWKLVEILVWVFQHLHFAWN